MMKGKGFIIIISLLSILFGFLTINASANEIDLMKEFGIERQKWSDKTIPDKDKLLGYWAYSTKSGLFILWHFDKNFGEVRWADFGQKALFPMVSFKYNIVQFDNKLLRLFVEKNAGTIGNELLLSALSSAIERKNNKIIGKWDIALVTRALVLTKDETDGVNMNFIYIDDKKALEIIKTIFKEKQSPALFGKYPDNLKVQYWPDKMPIEKKILGHWAGISQTDGSPDGDWYFSEKKMNTSGLYEPCTYEIIRKDEHNNLIILALTCPQKKGNVINTIYHFYIAEDSRAMIKSQKIKAFGGMELNTDLFYVDSKQSP